MSNVVRFALSTARDLWIDGAGFFRAGILDIDANNTEAVTRARYRVQPYRAVELGIMDSATPPPDLPAVPVPPAPDPYPQYLDPAEVFDPESGRLLEAKVPARLAEDALRAAFVSPTADGLELLSTSRRPVLAPFHAALGNRETARCNIVCIGDSLTAGEAVTTWERRWVTRLARQLRSRLRDSPDGGAGFIPADWPGPPSFTAPGITVSSWGTLPDYGALRKTVMLGQAGAHVLYNVTGTSVDVVYTRAATGTGYYKVDGGAAVTFNSSGPTLDGATVRVSLGTPGAHTVEVGWSSGDIVYHSGLIVYDDDEVAGIQVHGLGYTGWKSGDWISGDYTPENWPRGIAQLNPDLFIISLGANDFLNSVPAATFEANVQTLIADLRAPLTAPFPPVILHMVHEASGAGTVPWADFIAAAHAIEAADSQVLVVDQTLRLPAVAEATGLGLYTDAVHGSDAWHQLVADTLTSVLLPH